jgi:hypothetical protein
MEIAVSQVYTKAGVNFPFSFTLQEYVSDTLSSFALPTSAFIQKYGVNWSLIIRVNADLGTINNRIVGPSVFKKDKDAEFTLFLPYDAILNSADSLHTAIEFLLEGVSTVFDRVGIEAPELVKNRESIINYIYSEPRMLDEPWSL